MRTRYPASVSAVVAAALVAAVLTFLPSTAGAAPPGAAAPAAAGPVTLQILSINDFHGRLESPATDDQDRPVGGAAQLAGLVDQLRTANPNTAFVSDGDNIGASTFVSAIDQDNPTLDALNAMGLTASSVGNHEFDKGMADLEGRVSDRAQFPYLGANVYRDGQRALPAYEVDDIGGVQVGFVGVVTEQTPELVTPTGIAGLEFRDPVAELATVAGQLKDGNSANGEADVVVALAHEGAAKTTTSVADLEDDPVFGAFVDLPATVDAIFSGHTHQAYALEAPVPGGGTRPIVQAEDYGQKLGKVTLTFDPATRKVTNSTAALIDVVGYPEDPAVAKIVSDAKATSEVLGAEKLGSITADIKRDPNRATESVGANFIADVQLAATAPDGRGGAQIALMNPGGVRDDFIYAPDGVITYQEAFLVQPFANDVVTRTYTGAQIRQVLEEQWQPAGASRPVLWLGVSKGFTYEYDSDRPAGQRVDPASLKLDGAPIAPTGTYRVTVNSFLAAGGDNFATLAEGTDQVTTGENDLTMLTDYFAAHSPVTADPVMRSTRVYSPPAPFATWEDLIRQVYRDTTGREADDAVVAAWEPKLRYGEATPVDLAVSGLMPARVNDPAPKTDRLYLALLDRVPTTANYETWMARFESGWYLRSAIPYFLAAADSPLRGTTNARFVDLMYQRIVHQAPSARYAPIWRQRLDSGAWTRTEVVEFFVKTDRAVWATLTVTLNSEATVALLDRAPTPAEWAGARKGGINGTFSLEARIARILASPEYAARVGQD